MRSTPGRISCRRLPRIPQNDRVNKQIEGINSSPHILNVIHQLRLFGWPFSAQDEVEGVDSDSQTEEVNKFRNLYKGLMELISAIPNLYHFHCRNCVLPLALILRVRSISSLRTLYLYRHITSSPVHNLTNLQVIPSSLHVFEYSPELRIDFPTYRPYQTDIFKLFIHLLDQFTILSFPFYLLADLLADITLPATFLKLRKLSIFQVKHDVSVAQCDRLKRCIYKFLERTPTLRELRIHARIYSPERMTFSPASIPDLEVLIAPMGIANDIAKGRTLRKICILGVSDAKISDTYTVLHDDIEDVCYDGALVDPERDLPHLANMFPNATTLNITFTQTKYTNLVDTALSVLPKFSRLKSCLILNVLMIPAEYRRSSGPLSPYFTLGRAEDPKYRSHPTLEDIQILSTRWVWDPELGYCQHDPVTVTDHGFPTIEDKRFFRGK